MQEGVRFRECRHRNGRPDRSDLAGGYYNTATSATATEITTGIWTDVLGAITI